MPRSSPAAYAAYRVVVKGRRRAVRVRVGSVSFPKTDSSSLKSLALDCERISSKL